MCLNEKIKRKLKLRNFKKVFLITKQWNLKFTQKRRKLKFHKLWNSSLVKIKTKLRPT